MQMTHDAAQELTLVHNTMMQIGTTGDDTIKMAACISKVRELLGHTEIIEAGGEDAQSGE